MLAASGSTYSVICKSFTSNTGKSGGLLHAHCPCGVTYSLKSLVLPEGVSDYAEILKSMHVLPTITICDMADLVARHVNINYPGTFRPFDGKIADPYDKENTEDIKSGNSKVDFEFVPQVAKFDRATYDQFASPHPMSGHVSRLSIYDRLHEKNHTDSHLRRLDNISQFQGKKNTQAGEQSNSNLKNKGWFLNEMRPELYINLVTYKVLKINDEINEERVVELQKDFPNRPFHTNSKGVLVFGHYEDSLQDTYGPNTRGVKVTRLHPLAVLKNPSPHVNNLSWFNAAYNMLFFGPFFEALSKKTSILSPINLRLLRFLEDGYDQERHIKLAGEYAKRLNHDSCESLLIQAVREMMKTLSDSCNYSVLEVPIVNIPPSNVIDEIKKAIIVKSSSKVGVPELVYTVNPSNKIVQNLQRDIKITFEKKSLIYRTYCCLNCIPTSEGFIDYICSIDQGNIFYSICNDTIKVISPSCFVSNARKAEIVAYKLSELPAHQMKIPAKRSYTAPEINFDTRKKVRFTDSDSVNIESDPFRFQCDQKSPFVKGTIPNVSSADNMIMRNSAEHRMHQLPPDQRAILTGIDTEYDQVIIDRLGTLISCQYSCSYQKVRHVNVEYFSPLSGPSATFVQILIIRQSHWVVISNKLSGNHDIIEVFDSLKDHEAIERAPQQLCPESCEVVRAGLQLCPGAKTFKYIGVQIQDTDPYTEVWNGCGPLSVVNFWCLAKGFYPHCFPRVDEIRIRMLIKTIFETGRAVNFFQSTTSSALKVPKDVLLVYNRSADMEDTMFHLTERKMG